MTTYHCNTCNKDKEAGAFYVYSQTMCKACRCQADKDRRQPPLNFPIEECWEDIVRSVREEKAQRQRCINAMLAAGKAMNLEAA